MTAAVDIRRANPADAEALSDFAKRSFIDAYGSSNTPAHVEAYVASAFDLDSIRSELDTDDVVYLLGRQADRLVAYVKLLTNQPIDELPMAAPMQLERIYVDSGSQGGGRGAIMLGAALDVARETGSGALWLSAWEENVRAQAFYRRHGFEVVGQTHFMLGPERQEDVIMARRLTR